MSTPAELSGKQRTQQAAYAAHFSPAAPGTSPVVGGEQYLERWKQLDKRIMTERQRIRELDMALNACNKAKEMDAYDMDVGQARFRLERVRRELTADLTRLAADAALTLLLRRIDPTHELPPDRALAVLRAVGPARCPQTVKVCKEIRTKCRAAYKEVGDTRSVGWESAAEDLETHAVGAFLDTEESQMVFISMIEPCIATSIAFTEDEEVAARAARVGMFQTEPPELAALNEEDDGDVAGGASN